MLYKNKTKNWLWASNLTAFFTFHLKNLLYASEQMQWGRKTKREQQKAIKLHNEASRCFNVLSDYCCVSQTPPQALKNDAPEGHTGLCLTDTLLQKENKNFMQLRGM